MLPHIVNLGAGRKGAAEWGRCRWQGGDRHRHVPAQRYGTPAEVAAVVFLASDEASFITVHILNVDGGFGAAGVIFEPEMIFEPEEAE
jgi:NAD(P)-dependent dehydrogenase (short-subunit alcohol dehydrogenase family)